MAFRKVKVLVCILVVTTVFGAPNLAVAQNYDNPGLGELPVTVHPQDFKPLGIRAGSFMLHPGVQLAAEFTDNVFYTAEDEQSDTVWHIRPYITGQSTWSQHSFNVRLAADIGRHQDYDFRDYEDYFVLVNGRVDVRNRSYLSYNLDWMQLHESLNNRTSQQGIKPTIYTLFGAGLGYDHTFNRFSLGGRVDWRQFDYDNNIGFDGEVIDNQDRDRDEFLWQLLAGYQFRSDMQAFGTVSGYTRDYDQELDRSGINRDSDGWAATTGINFTMTGKLDGDVYVAYRNESFDDPRLLDVNGWSGGAGLHWTPTRMTSVGARIDSSIEATTYQYSSGYFMTLYSVRVDHELLRDLQLSAQASYRVNDYQLTDDAPDDARSKDKLWQFGVGLNYFFNRHVFVSASWTHDDLSSDLPLDEYDVNKVWLTLSLER